ECPYCRGPLWFVHLPPRLCYYGADEASPAKRDKIVGLLRRWMKADAAGWTRFRWDAPDAAGFLSEIERDFGRAMSLRDIATIRSLADLIDFLVRECPDLGTSS